MPRIEEHYRSYRPPPRLIEVVREALEIVPQRDLVGLKLIYLRDSSSLTRGDARREIGRGRRKGPTSKALGVYTRKSGGKEAQVDLFVDNIFSDARGWLARISVIRTTRLLPILYHELGHHVHLTHPTPGKTEVVAESYSREYTRKYCERYYRRWFPLLKGALWVLKRLRQE